MPEPPKRIYLQLTGEKCDDEMGIEMDCPTWSAAEINDTDTEYVLASEHSRLRAVVDKLRDALTPSAATKAAYIGEFTFEITRRDRDGDEYEDTQDVPWPTIKEIMAAILALAEAAPKE